MGLRPTNATLVIGSKGFLGKNVYKLLEPHKPIFTSIRGDTKNVMDLQGTIIRIDLFTRFECVTVFNCSSGRLQTKELSDESNFLFPTYILEELCKLSSKIIWVQFDSYTQYASGQIHDTNYVSSKNKFNDELDRMVSVNKLLSYHRISLPHLYGPGDNDSRFLPKVFSKVIRGIDVQVTSSRETLSLIDVQDCAREIIEIVAQPVPSIPNQFSSKWSIAPSENVEVYDFLNYFRMYLGSKTLVTRGHDDSKVFIEKWEKHEQPPVFHLKKNRSSREQTFRKVIESLELS